MDKIVVVLHIAIYRSLEFTSAGEWVIGKQGWMAFASISYIRSHHRTIESPRCHRSDSTMSELRILGRGVFCMNGG